MNTVQFDYRNDGKNSFLLQDLIYVEAVKNLRVAGGVVYSKAGFNPTAGMQYVYSGSRFLFLCAPRVNIESNPRRLCRGVSEQNTKKFLDGIACLPCLPAGRR